MDTPAGAARVAFYDGAGGAGREDAGREDGGVPGPNAGVLDAGAGLWVSLPQGLDAAEPGVVLETESAPPRVLGSVTTGPPWVPTPGGLPAEGRLVLMDLARNARLGATALPRAAPGRPGA